MVDSSEALRILIDLTRRLSVEEPLEDSLQAVTDAALELLPATHASVRLFDDAGSELLSSARSGEGVDQRPATFRPGEGMVGWVAESGERVRVDDVRYDARFKVKRRQGFTIRALVAVPLWSGGRVVGVLSATAPRAAKFTEQDEMLAQLLANCAVAPIERSRLRRMAVTDQHTRAFNQSYLFPRLRDEMERARLASLPLAVLLLDVDFFKVVNDRLGHAAGDFVLRAFADRVRSSVRSHDILVRRGGDEFTLIMPRTDGEQARAVAQRVRREVARRPFRVDGHKLRVTVTVGVALWDGDESAESLEGRADQAMYEGKAQGRDRVVTWEASRGANGGVASEA